MEGLAEIFDLLDEEGCSCCEGEGWIDNPDPVIYGCFEEVPCMVCAGTGLRLKRTLH